MQFLRNNKGKSLKPAPKIQLGKMYCNQQCTSGYDLYFMVEQTENTRLLCLAQFSNQKGQSLQKLHRYIWGRSFESSDAYPAMTYISWMTEHGKKYSLVTLTLFLSNLKEQRFQTCYTGTFVKDLLKAVMCVRPWAVFYGSLVLPSVLKKVWCMNMIAWDN